MNSQSIVFLPDVDNTLLDTDRVTADLGRYLAGCWKSPKYQRISSLFLLVLWRKVLGLALLMGRKMILMTKVRIGITPLPLPGGRLSLQSTDSQQVVHGSHDMRISPNAGRPGFLSGGPDFSLSFYVS